MASTLLTSGDAGTDEEEALGLESLSSADGIRVVGVAAVDDNIALLKVGNELVDEVVDGRAGFDEENDFAGSLQL
jgi:hypothetical protein